jgi:hypothetical protein
VRVVEQGESAERPSWAPSEVSLDEPSIARIWDWFLGGYLLYS